MAADTGANEQQYSLRWNDFHSAMLTSFRHLRDEEDFVDVTLACEGVSFSAHKVVLSACSPYFRKLLKANPCQHPIVILRDVHNKDMESLLRFMYHGEVHIGQEQLKDFLKAAQLLQVRGLTDVPTQGVPLMNLEQKSSPSDSSWEGSARESRREERRSRKSESTVTPPPPKRTRSSELYQAQMKSRSEQILSTQDRSPERMTNNAQELRDSLLSQALDIPPSTHMSANNLSGDGEDSSSDAALSDTESDIPRNNIPKQEPMDFGDESNMINSNGGILDPSRTPNFPGALLNLQGLLPGPSGMHGDNFGSPRRSHDMLRVRATDPRPCPKCGKIYRSAHTLRTHLEDKHTICPGYRCVLCGTVAKSRNSLHSHMSRQHRGISTKELPVLPMPSKFDPELASKLLAKAGVKISPEQLRARASPTGPRRSDIKLDAKSGQSAASETSSMCGDNDADDLSLSASQRYSDNLPSPPHLNNLANTTITKVPAVRTAVSAKSLESLTHNFGLKPDNYPPGLVGDSALLNTYIQYIGENVLGMGMNEEQKSAMFQAAKLAQMNAFGQMDRHMDRKTYDEHSPQMGSLPPPPTTLAHQHFLKQMQRQYTDTINKIDIMRDHDEPLDLGKERQRHNSMGDGDIGSKSVEADSDRNRDYYHQKDTNFNNADERTRIHNKENDHENNVLDENEYTDDENKNDSS